MHLLGDTELRAMSFRDWLMDISPDGCLMGYEDILEECYDTVTQVVRTYVVSTSRDGCIAKTLDTQLYGDLGISTDTHRHLFQTWFQQRRGVGAIVAAA